MDVSQYMPMFLAESREHLQELNLSVVRLEENPRDRETVAGIFRIAHSLKGMSATMGFARIAELTHEMEEVFELLRQRSGALESEAIDTVLACLDALSAEFEALESDGQERLDPEPLIKRLRHLVRARSPEQELARHGGADLPDLARALAAGARILHVTCELDDGVMMPGVRAHMVLAALAEHGQILGSVPAQECVELFTGRRIDVWLQSDHEEPAVQGAALGVSDVASASVSLSEREPPAGAEDGPPPTVTAAPQAAVSEATWTGGEAAARSARTVRVDAERLDALMHSMGELVVHRTAIEALTAELEVPGLQQAVANLTRSSQALQSMVMQVRMIPVEVVFLRFPRLVRDLSTKLGKDVELKLVGSETEFDRTVVEALGDPLVHLVRNALDHGLEVPEVRIAQGKPRTGVLEIAARHRAGSVVIEVRDDGCGIDPVAVARRAQAVGLIDDDAATAIDTPGAVELLFTPGFSTAEATSEISGRGVGMDAVRTRIRELAGDVTIESAPGRGTCVQIRLPLTLAIVSALEVTVDGDAYAIPLDRIERTLRLTEGMVACVAGRRLLVLEDGVLPLLEGGHVFGHPAAGEHRRAVVVHTDERRVALAVDELVGQRELVTRPLPAIVCDGQPVSGGAALADGRIALIVDCDALTRLAEAPPVSRTGRPAPDSLPLAA